MESSNIILTGNESSEMLQPFSLLKKVADLRMGFYTFRERWEKISGKECRYLTEIEKAQDSSFKVSIPQNLLPLNENAANQIISAGWNGNIDDAILIDRAWQMPVYNNQAIRFDFKLSVAGKISVPVPAFVKVMGKEEIFIEPGARLEHCNINTSEGPVYISKDALIMDGTFLRGPLFVGEGAVVKMGATIYGSTTIGPFCIVGGEIKNSIFTGYSNKAHHGYVGDSVIGEWCNLGAGTTTSNLKNTGNAVKVWNIYKSDFEYAGNKCGVLMGDFTRTAINTSFNTGTVTGICANIFNAQQLTPKFISGFSWGVDGNIKYDMEKALAEIITWMNFKNRKPDQDLIEKITLLYQNQQ